MAVMSFSLLSSKANVIKRPSSDEMLNHWLSYIHDQEKNFEMGPEDEAVVILGNGRSGKTTLSLLLTDGEMDGIQELNGSIHFTDPNDRIATGFTPKDTTPMLMVDEDTDTTYYDWIGFDATAGLDTELFIEHDVLASHLIKVMAKSNKALKFVFTVSQNTLDPTECMGTFLELVHRAIKLIRNVEKYRDAIAMVVTKVRGQYYSKKTDSYERHSEQSQIEWFTAYLKSVNKELEMRLQDRDVHGFTLEELENMRKFIDILLEKKDGRYQRIGIFQEPYEQVPVKYMTVQQHEKTTIKKIINENLRFVTANVDDFGYAVSKQTELHAGYDQLKARLEK